MVVLTMWSSDGQSVRSLRLEIALPIQRSRGDFSWQLQNRNEHATAKAEIATSRETRRPLRREEHGGALHARCGGRREAVPVSDRRRTSRLLSVHLETPTVAQLTRWKLASLDATHRQGTCEVLGDRERTAAGASRAWSSSRSIFGSADLSAIGIRSQQQG